MPAPIAVPTSRVAVLRLHGEFRVVCMQAIGAGERILDLHGVVVARPTRHTLQVGHGQHLEADDPLDLEGSLDRFVWRFLDHACEPNAMVAGRTLVALRGIEPGEAVTFDYTTTEFDMASPFPCRCGKAGCLQVVRGFRHLTAAQRQQRADRLAPHLRDAVAGELWIGTDVAT
jgi:hypothetical protein